MKVFLTGGTGLVGSHVAVHLRAAGHEVVALQRESSDVAHLGSLGCTVIPGDINDAAATLGKAMRGCDAVVHSAALV
jgi:nucleoside-diphosphate-sugar epimerase